MNEKHHNFKRGIAWIMLAVLLTGTFPAYARATNAETTPQETEPETDSADSAENTTSEQTVMFELDKAYDLYVAPEGEAYYQFQYTPERSAGYNLNCSPAQNMNIEIKVYDTSGHLLSDSGGQGDHFYMLKQNVPYFFEVIIDPQYKAQSGSGKLTLSIKYEENECLYISEDGTLTGASEPYYIIYVPEGVKTMKANANVYHTDTITLPESMESISTSNLWRCTFNYFVSGENGRYVSRDGVLYDKDNRALIAFPIGRRNTYTVEEGTEVIANWAFRGTHLSSLTFPNTVTTLERDFINSDTLKELTLSDNISDVRECFLSLYALEKIHVSPENPTFEERDGVLYRKVDGRYSLVYYPLGKEDVEFTVPEDVYAIEGYAFSRSPMSGMEEPVRNLTVLTIPKTVTVMDPTSSIFGYEGRKIPKIRIRGYEDSAAYQYYLDTYDWEKQYLSWGLLWEETEDDFQLGRDNNSFLHLRHDNENSGFYGTGGKYYLDKDCRNKLMKKIDESDKSLFLMLLARINGISLFNKWNGCCYGIAVTLGLVYNKDLPLWKINSNPLEKENIFQLPRPCDDERYLSVLNYYHLTQHLREQPSFAEIHNYSNEQKSSDEDIANLFRGVIQYLDQNQSVVLAMCSPDGGHAVLACDYQYLEALDTYIIKIYDMNSVKLTKKMGEFTQLKVSGDLTNFEFEGLGVSSDYYTSLDAILPGDIDVEQPGLFARKAVSDAYTTITAPTENPVTITDADGKYLMSDGKYWTGDMKIYNMRVIGTGTGENPGTEYIFEVEEGQQYTISGLDDYVEIEIYNSEGYLSLAGSQITSAELKPGQAMNISGNQYQFKAYISANIKDIEGDGGLASVSGNADNNISLNVLNDTVSVSSQGNVSNVKAMTYTEEDSIELELPDAIGAGEKKEIKIAGMEAPKDASVTILPGSHITKTKDSGPDIQTGLKGAIEEVVYTADAGYYFPDDYHVDDVNGIYVTRNSYTQITVSGTPTADTQIRLDGAAEKEIASVPTELSDGIEKINHTTTAMEYAASADAEKWTGCEDGSTAVTAGTWYVRYKETDTQQASPAAKITVTAQIYSFEIIPDSKDFGTLDFGYIQPSEQTITVKNTGNSPITLIQPTSMNYELGILSETNIDAGKTAAFTVQPKGELIPGTYNETIVVSADKGSRAVLNLNFIVRGALSAAVVPASAEITEGQSQTLTVNPAGGSGNYTYQWYIGAETTAFSTNKTITVSPTASTTYKVVVTDSDGGTQAAATATVIVVPNTTDKPNIIEGVNGCWKKGGKGGLSFRSNADFKKFQKVLVDGNEIKNTNYTAKEGSTFITLKPEYLETLAAGEHTISIVSENGTAETKFRVEEASKPVPTQPQKDKTDATKTGDNNPIFWCFLLMAFSLAGVIGILFKCRKRKFK